MSVLSITFREATIADHLLIAAVHAASWRSAYRGILPNTYLDGLIAAERAQLWQARLARPADGQQYVLLAEQAQEPIGFVCVLRDEEPLWGACLDNLHMHPDVRSRGVGRQLFAHAAHWLQITAPGTALYLWVFEANQAARRFYERYGGTAVERAEKAMPGGVSPPLLRYLWRDVGRLYDALTTSVTLLGDVTTTAPNRNAARSTELS